MEAITAIKVPDWAGLLEESGPDAVDGLFAQVLSGQQAKTGQGLQAAAGSPEEKGLKPERPGAEEGLPTASTDETSSGTPPLWVATAVLTSGSVPDGDPVPAGLGAEPGLPPLQEEGKLSTAFSLAALSTPSAGPAEKERNPNAALGGPLPKTESVWTASDPASPSPVRDGAGHDGASVAAPAGTVTFGPRDTFLSSPVLPEDYPTVSGGVPGTPEFVEETSRPTRDQALSPEARVFPPDEIPDEISSIRGSRPIQSSGEPFLTTEAGQTISVSDPDPTASPMPTPALAASSTASLRRKGAPGQTHAPEAFRVADASAPEPADLPSGGREMEAGFFKKESEMAPGVQDRGGPPPPPRPMARDFSGTFKAVFQEGPEAPGELVPRDPPVARESIPMLSTSAKAPGNEGEGPATAEGKFTIPPEGLPGPKFSLPLEAEMGIGRPPEMPLPEGVPKINGPQSGTSITDRAEETQRLFGQVSRGLVWSLHRGEEKIQITLDPPHLGTIFLELHRNRQTVEAQVWTDNPATKGLLDMQQGQLHKVLEQEGFRLDRFEVAVQPDLKSFSEGRFAQGRQPAWEGPRNQSQGGQSETAWSGEPERPISLFQHGNRYIDTWI